MKIILSTLLALSGLSLYAQPCVGSFSVTPKVGMTLSEPTGEAVIVRYKSRLQLSPGMNYPIDGILERNSSQDFAPKRKSSFAVGADFQYQASRNFAWVWGIAYAQLRSSLELKESNPAADFNIYDAVNTSNYIQLPMMAKLYIHKGLSIQTGLQFDWHLKSKVDLDYSFHDIRLSGDNGKQLSAAVNDYDYVVEVCEPHMDKVEKFELALPMGISYEYRNLVASALYSIALTRSAKASGWDSAEYRNSTFMFTLGYRINLAGK